MRRNGYYTTPHLILSQAAGDVNEYSYHKFAARHKRSSLETGHCPRLTRARGQTAYRGPTTFQPAASRRRTDRSGSSYLGPTTFHATGGVGLT
jgi:hypothetical protein